MARPCRASDFPSHDVFRGGQQLAGPPKSAGRPPFSASARRSRCRGMVLNSVSGRPARTTAVPSQMRTPRHPSPRQAPAKRGRGDVGRPWVGPREPSRWRSEPPPGQIGVRVSNGRRVLFKPAAARNNRTKAVAACPRPGGCCRAGQVSVDHDLPVVAASRCNAPRPCCAAAEWLADVGPSASWTDPVGGEVKTRHSSEPGPPCDG